jgi:mannosyltransferase OCH1-like enzyme
MMKQQYIIIFVVAFGSVDALRIAVASNSSPDIDLSITEVKTPSVPKIIHFTDKNPVAEWTQVSYITLVSWKSWQKFFPAPEYQTIVSSDADLEKCIMDEFPDFKLRWDKLHGVEKGDVGRYCMLHKHGGIYADLDYEVRSNFFDEINANGNSVTLLEAYRPESPESKVQVQNALMASPPRHVFWTTVFQRMQLAPEGEHKWKDLYGTGPRMLSNALQDRLDNNFTDMHLFPCEKYQRVGKCGDYHDLSIQKGIHWNQAEWMPWSNHGWNKGLIHDGFQNAHPDLGDVGLTKIDIGTSEEWSKLFKTVQAGRKHSDQNVGTSKA